MVTNSSFYNCLNSNLLDNGSVLFNNVNSCEVDSPATNSMFDVRLKYKKKVSTYQPNFKIQDQARGNKELINTTLRELKLQFSPRTNFRILARN